MSKRCLKVALLLALIGLTGSGCTQLQRVAVESVTGACTGVKPAVLLALDASGSQMTEERQAEQLELVLKVSDDTAASCGSLRLERFAGTLATINTISVGSVQPPGNTPEVREKNRRAVVDQVVSRFRKVSGRALDNVGSDPVMILQHGRRLLTSSPANVKILVVGTDGMQSGSLDVGVETAAGLPDLSGIRVVLAGIGRTAGKPPSTAFVEHLISEWEAICKGTRADSCTVVDTYIDIEIPIES